MAVLVGGLAVELAAWLKGQFRADAGIAADYMLDLLLRYMYHAGRAEALGSVVEALRRVGLKEAADAVEAALREVEYELGEVARELRVYDTIASDIGVYMAKRLGKLPPEKAMTSAEAREKMAQGKIDGTGTDGKHDDKDGDGSAVSVEAKG
ncbi:MAG: hypothetical protein F7C35_08215 [Desulfurococcales archaeon]|nr:hypothetical protein [Desulfurococcales archaeon]